MNILNWILNNLVNIVIIAVIIYFGALYFPRIYNWYKKTKTSIKDNVRIPSNESEVRDFAEKEEAGGASK